MTFAYILLAVTAAVEGQDHAGSAPADIVVIGRRVSEDPPPLATISSADIDSFAAQNVGDAIAAAKLRVAGDDPPVIVNGRRLGSIADITALPPEAIERIEILPPSAGVRRGLGGGKPVINVVLKKHFRSSSATLLARATGKGDSDNENLSLDGALLKGERRSNLDISASRQSALRYRDRFDRDALAAPGSPDPQASLLPASKTISVLVGQALQIGQKQLSISVNGNRARSISDLGELRGTQRLDSGNLGVSATLSGLSGRHFWFATAGGTLSRSDTRTDGSGSILTSRSSATNANLTVSLSGPVLNVPAGGVQYNGGASLVQTSVSQIVGGTGTGARRQRSLDGQAGLELPLSQRGSKASFAGNLSARFQAHLSRNTGSDTLLGYENALHWEPIKGLNLDWTSAYQPLGSAGQLTTISVEPEVLLFDPMTQQSVRVRQISGGNPALRAASQRRSFWQASYLRQMGRTNATLSLYYTADRTDDPVLTPSPSLVFEQAFPDRFTRDARGQLLAVDSRPLNGYRQSSESLSGTAGATGQIGPQPDAARAQPRRNAPHWTFNLRYAAQLRQRLQLTATSPTLDLKSAQIGALGGAGARSALSAQAGIGSPRIGTQIRIAWSSNTVLLGQGGGANGIYHQPLRLSIDTNATLGRSAAQGRSIGKFRLNLAVDNVLDARPRVTFPDRATPFAMLPANLDRLGRTIRLSLRAALF